MSRVSERSSATSMNFSINQAKNRLEDLQVKGSQLKKVIKPSDDPNGNNDIIRFKGQKIYHEQLRRNIGMVTSLLEYNETTVREVSDILVKLKELAVAQSSDFYNADVRKNVAMEVRQLRHQMLALANKQLGSRYLFGGFNILQKPFPDDEHYQGDDGIMFVEVFKGFRVPINIPGSMLFLNKKMGDLSQGGVSLPLERERSTSDMGEGEYVSEKSKNIFSQLKTFEEALLTNESVMVQNLLEDIDETLNKIISFRTHLGTLLNTINNTELSLEELNLSNEKRRTTIEDADIVELFSDLEKQNEILKSTYKASNKILSNNLMNFLR